tara:strand:- start:66 stop:575 length:510 start_codon:yes stop_codon:yes gene_type:complete
MRAINLFVFFSIFIVSGCTTIQVAEVVTKTSIKVAEGVEDVASKAIKNISKSEEKKEKEDILLKEKEELNAKKSEEGKVATKQKKIAKVNFIGKTLDELIKRYGEPSLIRNDTNTKTVRFDTLNCRVFIYFNNSFQKPRAEYFEIRDTKGNLVDRKYNIDNCFNEIANA